LAGANWGRIEGVSEKRAIFKLFFVFTSLNMLGLFKTMRNLAQMGVEQTENWEFYKKVKF